MYNKEAQKRYYEKHRKKILQKRKERQQWKGYEYYKEYQREYQLMMYHARKTLNTN